MSCEEGIVIRVDPPPGTLAWVQTVRSSACESCSERDSCTTDRGSKIMEVRALNSARAQVGDRVMLMIETSSLLKVYFLLYIFPVLCMIGGALVGQQLALARGHSDPTGLSAIMAFVFFGIAFLLIRLRGKSMGRKSAYAPRIIKILKPRADNGEQAEPMIEIQPEDPSAG